MKIKILIDNTVLEEVNTFRDAKFRMEIKVNKV
jgi:hypothetical protein